MRKHDLTPYSYLIADLIHKYTSGQGFCNQTLKFIAHELSISTRNITRCVSILIEKGLIGGESPPHPPPRVQQGVAVVRVLWHVHGGVARRQDGC